MAAQVGQILDALVKGLAKKLTQIPALAGHLAGIIAGTLAATAIVINHVLHQASKIPSMAGRRELVYGENPGRVQSGDGDVEVSKAINKASAFFEPNKSITESKPCIAPGPPINGDLSDGVEQIVSGSGSSLRPNHGQILATSQKETADRKIVENFNVKDAEDLFSSFSSPVKQRPAKKSDLIGSTQFTPPVGLADSASNFDSYSDVKGLIHSQPIGAPSTHKSALTSSILADAATERNKIPIQAIIPPKDAAGSGDDKLSPAAVDEELRKPLEMPLSAVSLGLKPSQDQSKGWDSDPQSAQGTQPSDSVPEHNPVLYESTSSDDHCETHRGPKEVSNASPDCEVSLPAKPDIPSTPAHIVSHALSSPGQSDLSSQQDFQSPSISPRTGSNFSSPDGAQGKGKTEKKKKGVKGAFRKIKKALSNK